MSLMDPGVWVTALTSLILAIILFAFSSLSYRRLNFCYTDDIYRFVPSKWALALALFAGSMSFSFFWIAFDYNPDLALYVVFGGMGTIWLAINLYWFFKVKSSYCIIYKDCIELKYGRKIRTAELSEIHYVNQVYYDIRLLNADRKVKLQIPMIFKGSHNMLGILQQRVLECKQCLTTPENDPRDQTKSP